MGEHGDITSSEVPLDANGRTYHICADAQNIAKKVFVVGDPARVDTVAKYFDKVTFRTENREIRTVTGEYKGQPMTVMSTGIGTDNVDIVVTELHILNEFDVKNKTWKKDYEPLTIIRIGTCGCPQPDIEVGDLVITSYSIGLDNTGVYYPHKYDDEGIRNLDAELVKTPLAKVHPYTSKATPKVVEALEKASKQVGAKTYTGITASASGFYGPQGRIVGRLGNILIPDMEDIKAGIKIKAGDNNYRIVCNEMESSSLNRLCNVLGYNCGTICLVLAARARGKQKFLDNEGFAKGIDACTKAALEAMHSL